MGSVVPGFHIFGSLPEADRRALLRLMVWAEEGKEGEGGKRNSGHNRKGAARRHDEV